MREEMVIKGDWSSFLNLKGEELFFVKRGHIFTLFSPIIFATLLIVVFISSAYFVFNYLIPSFPLFIVTSSLFISGALSLIAYSLVYWYFHLYVLTNRKILEVWYTPLFSHIVNEVLLDKVNCTEIDTSSKGFFHELIDMGDLTITFDRPTHQEEFTLSNIKNCDELSKYLMQKLMDNDTRQTVGETIWLRPRHSLIPKLA